MNAAGPAFGRAAIVAAVALALDQLTKAIARGSIEQGERIELPLGVDLVRVSNEGIAFGLLAGSGRLVAAVAAVAFLLLLIYFLQIGRQPHLWLPIGLLAGGALGNLIDRLRLGAVTDFIDPPRWPAFNVADVEITVAVIAIAIILLRGDPDQPDSGGEPTGAVEGRR